MQRHIEVIPEIDVPGHARAAIKAMDARAASLTAAGKPEEAAKFRLSDPEDMSTYRSVQMWRDNVVNPCQESTYAFLGVVIDDIVSMYTEAGAPLSTLHTGGDEVPRHVWEKSKACEAVVGKVPGVASTADLPRYFLGRLNALVAAHKLVTGGWEEIGLTKVDDKKVVDPTFLDKNLLTYVWNNVWGWGDEDVGYKLANAGYKVVLANATNLYFDLAYEKDPEEPGYYWASITETRKPFEFVPENLFESAYQDQMGNPIDQVATYANRVHLDAKGLGNILGLQGELWSENIRSPETLEYLAFPRVLALAERAWSPAPDWASQPDQAARVKLIDVAWNQFANSLGQVQLPRLDYLFGGVGYRLSPPGAVIEGGELKANTAYPGLTIRYTTDGSEPTAASPVYTAPVAVSSVVKLKTFDSRGRGSRTVA